MSERPAAAVGVREAKARFSRLLARVEAGEEIVIARNGRPAARIVACKPRGKRWPGVWKGKIEIDDDFFDPLSEEDLAAWEGRWGARAEAGPASLDTRRHWSYA